MHPLPITATRSLIKAILNFQNIKLLGAVIRKGCIFLKNVCPPFRLKSKNKSIRSLKKNKYILPPKRGKSASPGGLSKEV